MLFLQRFHSKKANRAQKKVKELLIWESKMKSRAGHTTTQPWQETLNALCTIYYRDGGGIRTAGAYWTADASSPDRLRVKKRRKIKKCEIGDSGGQERL